MGCERIVWELRSERGRRDEMGRQDGERKVSSAGAESVWQTHLDDIGPHDLTNPLSALFPTPATPQRMLNLLIAHHRRHLEPRQIRPQQPASLLQITLPNLPQPRNLRLLGHLIVLYHPRQTRVARDRREARLDELLRVEVAVVVLAAGDGGGEIGAGGVDGLEDAFEVGAAGDFLDEERSETAGAELLVHAEEVDLGAALGTVGR